MSPFNVHRKLDNGYDLYVGEPVVEAGFTQQDILEMSSLAFESPMRYGLDRDIRRNHIVVADKGKVIGSVYAHPRTYVGPDFEIKSIGIGAVSVHPDYREQGIMSVMMRTALELCREEGVAFMSLSGQRQRYQTFGFDNVSPHPEYIFNRRNFRGVDPMDPDRVETLSNQEIRTYEALDELFQIYLDHTQVTCRETLDDFKRSLLQWGKDAMMIRNDSGQITGYLIVRREQAAEDGPVTLSTDEVNLEMDDLVPLLAHLTQDARVEVVLREQQVELHHRLERYTEGSRLRHRIKVCFTNCEQCLKLALTQYPYDLPQHHRVLRVINALGDTEVFDVPAQSPGETIELSYPEFRALFSVQTRFELPLEVQTAFGPLLPLTLPDLHADQD